MSDEPPKKELSAKEKKAAAKAAKAARRQQKVDVKGGPTEPEVKKPVKKEEKTKQTQKGGKSNNEGKTERHNSGSRFSTFLFDYKKIVEMIFSFKSIFFSKSR